LLMIPSLAFTDHQFPPTRKFPGFRVVFRWTVGPDIPYCPLLFKSWRSGNARPHTFLLARIRITSHPLPAHSRTEPFASPSLYVSSREGRPFTFSLLVPPCISLQLPFWALPPLSLPLRRASCLVWWPRCPGLLSKALLAVSRPLPVLFSFFSPFSDRRVGCCDQISPG